MKYTNGQIANAYGVGVFCINILFFLADILFMVFWGDFSIAIPLATFAIYISITLNYKKYQYMKNDLKISFFRVVIFDSMIMSLGYIQIIVMNKEGYLDLTTGVFPVLTMIPLLKTNKKIKLD